MMSTISGLIVGMLIAALVTVMYGQELSDSLRQTLARHGRVEVAGEPATPALPQPGPNPARLERAEESPGKAPAQQQQQTSAMDLAQASDAVPVAAAVEPGEKAPPAQPTLEQRWFAYASAAQELEPVGSYPWQECFQRAAASYELPLALLLAIASGESNFDPVAISDKNAVGLMQIRWPDTSRHLGVRRQADLYDPCTNVDAGARYVRELTQHYDDNLHLAVAAYNYGPSRISAGQVPQGALWYSHYIFQHLQQVLGQEPTATSELIALEEGSGSGRDVLMSFNQPHRARDFIAFLLSQVPDLNLQQQSESLGRHDVVLLYSDPAEKSRALQALADAGLETLAPRPKSTYQL